MLLPRAGREYVNFDLDEPLPEEAVLEIQVGSNEWVEAEMIDASSARVLVYGPNAPTGDGNPVTEKQTYVRMRLADEPEIVIRGSGWITLTE